MKNDIFIINLYFDLKNKLIKDDFYQLLLSWFGDFNCSIGYRSGKTSALIKFLNDKKFHSFLLNTNSCSFHGGGNSDYEGELEMFKWMVFAQINFETGEIILSVQESLINDSKNSIVSHVIKETLKYNYRIYYGYAFSGERVKTLGYSSSILFYEINDNWEVHNKLAKKVKKWSNAKKNKIIIEKFRNIYSINIFSSFYINFTLDGVIVKDWIQKNTPDNIQSVCDNLYLWAIPENEINDIRDKFISENRIWEI